MRLATFNLESLDDTSGDGVPLAERAEILRPQLARLSADVLCLQEVNGQRAPGESRRGLHALDALLRGTAYEGYHRAASTGPHGDAPADKHNLVILSRLPIASSRELKHALVPAMEWRLLTAEPPAGAAQRIAFERPVLLGDIALADGRTLHVANVHLRAPIASAIPGQKTSPFVWRSTGAWAEGYHLSALKRSGQALELRLALEEMFAGDPHALVAVAGDFNAEDHETPLRILIGAEEDTGNGHLAGRSLAVLDRALAADRRFSVVHHGRPQMLDHILVSRALMAGFRSIEAHNEVLGDEVVGYARVEHSAGSYHAPVVAELAV